MTASVFFSSDVANPDTYPQFYCDLQMYTTTMTQPDPELFMNQFLSWEAATKANKWQGRNITRWRSKEYDDSYKAGQDELDPVKRAAMFIKANDLVINDRGRDPGRRPPRRRGAGQQAQGRPERLGQQHLGHPGLVQGGLIVTSRRNRRRPAPASSLHAQRRAADTSGAEPRVSPVHHPPTADRDPEPARDQRRAVHGAGAGAGRSVRRARRPTRRSRRRCAAALRAKFGLDDPVWICATCTG